MLATVTAPTAPTFNPDSLADFDRALAAYCAHLLADYHAWGHASGGESFHVDRAGSTYARVIGSKWGDHRSAHSFVVLRDTAKFKRGDILKAAGWKAPATNFRRGTIFEPATYRTARWSGL